MRRWLSTPIFCDIQCEGRVSLAMLACSDEKIKLTFLFSCFVLKRNCSNMFGKNVIKHSYVYLE